ncbi:TetR/AcrR family transcriptional regulator [Streptomyces sp. XM83C]|jgi:AcrR family transcriptional regulator|uniref:TetR/AcrR family transcriptional regulator n=1 Tax=Streptomyces thermocoprophilus TaxID=78356 RepID=A0ABV5VCU2_9ACTN|nr:TetR/AcrR family transcriptional regulator [Streptomyces sp. XM83C]MCK1823590.1 TetR/AcrR family transcriptional regulator [Streptomyces sp. XM83C]
MPKINAATVAEHRAQQRAALIRAAVDILVAQGATAVTPAAVGARAGLARSSFYQYFPSSAALLASIVEEAFTAADAAIAEALADVHEPAARFDAFIRTELHLAAQGAHRPAKALLQADLPPECLARVHELHHRHNAPLQAAITALTGETDASALTAQLVGGTVQAAMTAIEHGADPTQVTDRALALLHHGLNTPARQPHP